MLRSTCIPLYPATDGRQIGNSFVADTRHMLTATSGYKWNCVRQNVFWCKRGLKAFCLAYHDCMDDRVSNNSQLHATKVNVNVFDGQNYCKVNC